MFTLRFIKQGGKGYKAFTCHEYAVETPNDRNVGSQDVTVQMITNPKKDDELQEPIHTQVTIGAEAEYDLAYVTNAAGRTIDTVRHKDSARRQR